MNKTTLYGKDKNGGIKIWETWVENGSVFVSHGKIGGKIQIKETKCSGKNIGRANETTPQQQAELESASKAKKQFDKGYRESIDQLEELPLMPVLAYPFDKKEHVMSDEVYVSRKLDGVRCLVFVDNGNVRLMSRGGKDYIVPHISEEFSHLLPEGKHWFDGEIYSHGNKLQTIVSAVKRINAEEVAFSKKGNADDLQILNVRNALKFYLFEKIEHNEDGSFRKYAEVLDDYCKNRILQCSLTIDDHTCYVGCNKLVDKSNVPELSQKYYSEGYEGVMVRHKDFVYESGKRSNGLLKCKPFMDLEFKVIGVKEDLNGNAVLLMQNDLNDETFETSIGSFAERKYQLHNQHEFIGKWLTVQYQGRTEKGIPFFPVGKAWREADEQGVVLE